MAIKVDTDRPHVLVEKGDTLTEIAQAYAGGYSKYKQLAAINKIANPDRIYVGEKIYLTQAAASGGSTSSTTTTSSGPTKATINQFGLLSTKDDVLFATWTWERSNTASFKVLWTYDTGNGIWFEGSNSTINIDKDAPEMARQSTYSIPANARKVRFKVKPISAKKKTNNTETSYWEAQWSDVQTYTDSTPLETPSIPTVTIDKYKLTATLDNLTIDATGIEFEIVKDNAATSFNTGKATIVTGHVSYSCTVDAGSDYKVRCRAYKGSDYSDWSAYSNNEGTMPAAPSGITSIKSTSKTSVYLEWGTVNSATSYDIEYTTEKRYFDGSDGTTTKNGIETNHFELTGLESGDEYFFRVRAVNKDGASAWCEPKSVTIGEKPAAPTTWSSTTTAITGEVLNLYWVHNAADGSSQTYAELELIIDGIKETHTIENDRSEDEKDKTSVYFIDTTKYQEGTKILWRVRTAGVTLVYGDWSIQRTVDIYAPPTLELQLTDADKNSLSTVTAFPIRVYGLPGPKTQAPTSYHLTITSNEVYETVDNIGNPKTINRDQAVYSQHFDISTALDVILSAGDIDLENNVTYTVTCVVSMNSGLTKEASLEFNVTWEDQSYEPNAEISVDEETYTAAIRPYCSTYSVANHVVAYNSGAYTITDEIVDYVYGEIINGATTPTGEQVYSGTSAEGEELYFCKVESYVPVDDVTLAVYRREFDGSFTELATGLENAKFTTIIDPHPSLDFARYRIVATSKTTGAVSFNDLPGYPIGGIATIIQWDEVWTSFETSETAALEQPPWSGSLLKLPYNIDISDSSQPDVALVKYIGRSHPVAYYGTQRGSASTWNMAIRKDDKETLYALRRLANWMGNVYVREPSGSGYWANIKVSFSQKHRDLIIPVTLNVSRVEGGA
jgi:hypothetical protein